MSSEISNPEDCVIDLDIVWMSSLKEKVIGKKDHEEQRQSDPLKIVKVHPSIRQIQPDVYEPRVVSIGPYHRHKENLKEINDAKILYVRKLLEFLGQKQKQHLNQNLKDDDEVRLEACMRKMKELEEEARAAYSESINMNSNDFCEMMLLDGAFIIIFTLDSRVDQPSINIEGAWEDVYVDLLLVENQLPFFILENLFKLTQLDKMFEKDEKKDKKFETPKRKDKKKDKKFETLVDLVRREFYAASPVMTTLTEGQRYHHILHLIYLHLVSFHSSMEARQVLHTGRDSCLCGMRKKGGAIRRRLSNNDNNTIPCATRLQEAGIKFMAKTGYTSYLDVTFHKRKAVLEIPPLTLYGSFVPQIRNLIALEINMPELGSKFRNYARFMDHLIDTAEDVALLQDSNIIFNYVGSNKVAASIFNKLDKNVFANPSDDYLLGLREEVRKHYNSVCNRNKAKLMKDYFSSPWTLLSLVGALTVMSLTLVQAVFASVAYFRPPPNNN